MPGVSYGLLKEFGVRMVAIDRPGTGQSDPDYQQSFLSVSQDVDYIIDSLDMGEKVWILGFSCGGGYSWAAAYRIPHRIAGLILFCPVGNYSWKGITREDRREMATSLTASTYMAMGKYIPVWLTAWYMRTIIVPRAGAACVQSCQNKLSPPDRAHLLESEASKDLMRRDNLESLTLSQGYGMAKDLEIVSRDWGFEPQDIPKAFQGPIHLWQGDQDWLVPLKLQQWIKSQIPEAVTLHVLEGEGHLSWFCSNDRAHLQVFNTAFRSPDI